MTFSVRKLCLLALIFSAFSFGLFAQAASADKITIRPLGQTVETLELWPEQIGCWILVLQNASPAAGFREGEAQELIQQFLRALANRRFKTAEGAEARTEKPAAAQLAIVQYETAPAMGKRAATGTSSIPTHPQPKAEEIPSPTESRRRSERSDTPSSEELITPPTTPSPRGSAGTGSTDRLSPIVERASALLLVLPKPSPGDSSIISDVGEGLAYRGVREVGILGEYPDLSTLAPDGTLIVSSHGSLGRLKGSDGKEIPIDALVKALTHPKLGLPSDFRGTIELGGCSLGLRPTDKPKVIKRITRELLDTHRLNEEVTRWITDALAKNRILSHGNLAKIRDVLQTKHHLQAAEAAAVTTYL